MIIIHIMKAEFNLIVSQYMQHLKYFLAKTCMMINAWGVGREEEQGHGWGGDLIFVGLS